MAIEITTRDSRNRHMSWAPPWRATAFDGALTS